MVLTLVCANMQISDKFEMYFYLFIFWIHYNVEVFGTTFVPSYFTYAYNVNNSCASLLVGAWHRCCWAAYLIFHGDNYFDESFEENNFVFQVKDNINVRPILLK